MMRLRCVFMAVVVFVAACGMFDFKPDKSSIVGIWKAESFDFEGLKLPVSPNIEVTGDTLILMPQGQRQALALEDIEVKDKTVTLTLKGALVGLSFFFESKDRMYFKVPLVGTRIYFSRS